MASGGIHTAEPQTIDELYRALRDRSADASEIRSHIALRHWLHDLTAFDELTGQAMPQALSELCERIRTEPSLGLENSCKDRLYRIVDHVRQPLPELFRGLGKRLVREQAMLPVHAVRELDSGSFAALCRRPGRTIREKLAGRPNMLAVRRRATVDTGENRLLKALCLRLSELLTARAECFGSCEPKENTDLDETIESWLHCPDADEIGRWENMPPNNILLRHRNYRRLWNAWRWVQSLDSDVQMDRNRLNEQWAMALYWTILAQLQSHPCIRLPEQPCYLEYEQFWIRPAMSDCDNLVSTAGLLFPSIPAGYSRGKVTKLGQDKNGNGYGFAETDKGESIFFHSNRFHSHGDYDRIQVGTHLAFKVVASADNRLAAANVEICQPPKCFRICLNANLKITLNCEVGSRRVLVALVGKKKHQLQVIVGNKKIDIIIHLPSANIVASMALADWLPSVVPSATATLPERNSLQAVVDLAALCPRFADDAGNGTMPFRLLWQLWQPPDQEATALDLTRCRAISLHRHATTVSILDLLAAKQEQRLESGMLSQAAKAFAGRLADFLNTQSLTYLVPDAADDFSLEPVRASLNARFSAAQPLPRSIAAVFAWQSSKDYASRKVGDGDCVIVLDAAGHDFCATLVRARYRKELTSRVTATRGICWERYPAIEGDGACSKVSLAVRALQKCKCNFPHEVGRLCGLEGILEEAGNVSWMGKDGEWFTAPPELPRFCCESQHSAGVPWSSMIQGLQVVLRELPNNAQVFILVAGDKSGNAMARPPNELLCGHRSVVLPSCDNLARGGMIYHQWQQAADDIPLWRDHLPELSIRIVRDGKYQLFPLVKDVTVAPKRGVAVAIPIADVFVLPAGQEYYQFPLLQGAEGNELRYEAYLTSAAFPLKSDIPCRLVMTFTFGEDEPYRLVFLPLDLTTAGFAAVQARWRQRSTVAPASVAFPRFPSPEGWEELQRWPKPGSDETSDLLDWISKGVDKLAKQINGLNQARHVGTITGNWRTDKNGQLYTFAKCDAGSVFCHSTDFLDEPDAAAINVGNIVAFELRETSDGKLRAERITLGDDIGPDNSARILRDKLDEMTQSMRKGLRFPFLIVWSGGRSLHDSAAPDWFRKTVVRGSETLLHIITMPTPDDKLSSVKKQVITLKDEALFLLCCLHRDAPPAAPDELLKICSGMPDSFPLLAHKYRHFGLAIGDSALSWQQSLLQEVLRTLRARRPKHSCVCLQILAISLWRNPLLLEQLKLDDLQATVGQLADCLDADTHRISDHASYLDKEVVKDHLELLLGLLNTRAAKDTDIRSLLGHDQPLTQRFAILVEKISDKISTLRFPLRSRVQLSVDKPRELYNTPDLLYALRLYLTGDSAANAIQVTGVSDDE